MKRFRNLSAAQQSAFEQIASGWSGGSEFHPRTMKALEAAGLVVGEDVIDRDAWPPITVRQYRVPLTVHMEWCSWCYSEFDVCMKCDGAGCTGCDYSGMVEKADVAKSEAAK